ncbi:patched domain-containing protein 3 [Lingula anatina]|uniref:Patched domain-containing protein 3 n=1 Tax=Lingula anatina TaxID=7574 RepID=A0A2R2MS18_LINAN|nr:patched domain-containing protein 3 [Lingula anatina]|eukprot:XP_023933054.1 patched domain-containing protein 3 [Lingula anatina]
MTRRWNCVERPLSRVFYRHGAFLARHPFFFFLVPLLLAIVLSTGMNHFTQVYDIEYLFTPENGRGKLERTTVEHLFPTNTTKNFNAHRLNREGRYSRLIITAKDDGDVLREDILRQVLEIDKTVNNISVDGYKFIDICGRWEDACAVTNPFLVALNYNASNIRGVSLSYPTYDMPIRVPIPNTPYLRTVFLPLFLGGSLGGADVDEEKKLQESKAIQLVYYLDETGNGSLADEWEQAFMHEFEELVTSDKFSDVNVAYFTSQTLQTELAKNREMVIPLFTITIAILVLFSVLSCLMSDWVRSKPWLGVLGVVTAALAIISSFGLLLHIGVEYNDIVAVTPFLILGIGVDNMFVMLASWRETDPRDSVEKRMAGTFSDAGVSITITAITDVVSFVVGSITFYPSVRIFCLYAGIGVDNMFVMLASWRETDPRDSVEKRMAGTFSDAGVSITITAITDVVSFVVGSITFYPSVRIFCLYAGVALVFHYCYQITFFGACMAWIGRREKANRHCITLCKVIPEADADHKSKAYRIFCAGGTPESVEIKKKKELNKHHIMIFFRDCAGPFLSKRPVKFVVIGIYLAYLAVALFGCTRVREGIELRNMPADDSYAVTFYELETEYFKKFGPKVAVVFDQKLNYLNSSDQELIQGVLEEFENDTDFFYKQEFECWLTDFLLFANESNIELTESNFIPTLENAFLKMPGKEKYKSDIVYNENRTEIIASRCFVQSTNTNDTVREKDMMMHSRAIADNSELNVTVYHPAFVYYDQYVTILPNMLQNVGIAWGSMMLVALFLIPDPVCSMWVALSVASIEVGVIGYMTLWGVNLDYMSMIYVIICIGFSVDFSAHIAYAYVTAKGKAKKRIRKALYVLGLPILQGALSTILGVLVLSQSSAYMFRTFFKIIFMVILFGAFHGLVIIPVVLSLCMRGKPKKPESTTYKQHDCTEEQWSELLERQKQNGGAGDITLTNLPPPSQPFLTRKSSTCPGDLNMAFNNNSIRSANQPQSKKLFVGGAGACVQVDWDEESGYSTSTLGSSGTDQ